MFITVAICTWNRAKLLDQTLAEMHKLRIPDGVEWELLVVNNNCTDDTDAVIVRHTLSLPLRRLHEPKQGHSNARNCAIAAARGELLLWTDDDVLVDPDWITEYVVAANRFPQAGFFGGTVDPWFANNPPRWVQANLDRLEGPFALRRFGPDVRLLTNTEQVFGANMAFRTALMKDFRFDPALGRVGNEMLSGDETDLVARLQAAGWSGVWVGTARVRHYIPAGRLTAAYVWKFFHGLGRTSQRRYPSDLSCPQLFGVPRWLIRQYLADRVRSLFLAPFCGASWLDNYIRAAVFRGVIDECRTQPVTRVQT